jgi:NTE family protein
MVVGTSAGASVAAAVLQAGSASEEFDRMVRKSRRNPELSPHADLAAVFSRATVIHERKVSLREKTGGFIRLSRDASGVDPQQRREVIGTRLHGSDWPDIPLFLTAVDANGATRSFTKESGVGLLDVVTASCAVPGVWPVAEIDGEDYVDGGTFSLTNAELAATADNVLILRPMPENPAYQTAKRTEVFSHALVLEPSERARTGFGPNPFDPDVRGVAAVLGYEDGLAALGRRKDAW